MPSILELFELLLILAMIFTAIIITPLFLFHLLGVLLGAA